ncbi:L-lactate dehydrogenase [Klebsiella pneumoniae subsp. rhinoscleromatis]|nr:L-lactate dehydrogenase [Klebsiella pneumoniae subsp. rhinoscleromatis]
MIISAASDYRAAAQRILPPFLFHYIDGGAYAEHTLRRNVEDLSDVALRQRILRNMSDLSLETTLFNEKLAMPTALAPVGLCGMYARRGEVQAAGAADDKGIPFTLSTVSVCPIEEVAPDHQAPDVVPAVCPARPRLYAQCAGARQSRRLLDAGLYRRYADSRRPLPRRPFRHERPERRPAPLLAVRHPSRSGRGTSALTVAARSGQYLRLSRQTDRA